MKQIIIGAVLILVMNRAGTNEVTEIRSATVHKVTIAQMRFEPAEIHVHKGDRILFKNDDLVIHDVTEEEHSKWSSGHIAVGGTWVLEVRQGDRYYCSIHKVMKGRIIVDR